MELNKIGRSNAAPVNPHVAALPAYNASLPLEQARAISGRDDIARLASDGNPYGCAPAVSSALAGALEPWRYADPGCTSLRAALSADLDMSFRLQSEITAVTIHCNRQSFFGAGSWIT